MKMAKGKLNPTFFWGVKARGLAYGNLAIMDPDSDKPLLGVIDSGTTLAIMPTIMLNNLLRHISKAFKNVPDVDLVCTRAKETGILDHCYFNNTHCNQFFKDHSDKMEDLKIVLGDYVFVLKAETLFK